MATNGKPGTALALMAQRVSVEPAELQQTLIDTVFKGATKSEFVMLVAVANKYDLDPLVREIYAFPKKGGGIVPLVPIDGWLKIIHRHPDYAGMDTRYADEMVVPAQGAKRCPEWIETTIYHKSTPDHPTVHREWIDEMYRNTGPWNDTTKRMLEWKSIIQTGRKAFGLGGIFDEDEAERINAGEYDVESTATEETGEVIGQAEYDALLAEMERTQISLEAIAKNVAVKAGYEGALEDMPMPVWESLMAGLAQMPTKGEAAETASAAPESDQEPAEAAESEQAAFPGVDPEPPGRGPANVTPLNPDGPATPQQMAEVKKLRKGLNAVEFEGLVAEYGEPGADNYGLTQQTAGFLVEALRERGAP